MKQKYKQILLGSLLGDGYIGIPRNSNPRFSEGHSIKQEDYIKWKVKNLPFSFNIWKGKNNGHKVIQVRTKCREKLKDFHNLKLKEKLEKLDVLGVLIWYLDDGSYQYSGEHLTLGNKKNSDKKIKKWYKEELDVEFKETSSNYLRLNRKDSKKLLPKLIDVFNKYNLPNSISYKLGFDEKRREKARKTRKKYDEENWEKRQKRWKKRYREKRDELTKTDRREWSKEEIETLKNNYKNKTDEELSKMFKNRTPSAVSSKRLKLGLKKKNIVRKGKDSPNWKGGKQKVKCDYCGADIKKYPSLINKYNFCNKDCFRKWQKEGYHPKHSKEFKEKMSKLMSGENNPMYGVNRSS